MIQLKELKRLRKKETTGLSNSLPADVIERKVLDSTRNKLGWAEPHSTKTSLVTYLTFCFKVIHWNFLFWFSPLGVSLKFEEDPISGC